MVDFVTKPIQPDELWAALLRWIKPRHAWPAKEASILPATTASRETSPQSVAAPSLEVDPARLRKVCQRLVQLLEDDDSEAGDLFADEGDLLHAAYPQHYHAIDDAIKGFDLDLALENLKAALAATGMEEQT
jgi:two-component system sensor histidine kinase/response regulator